MKKLILTVLFASTLSFDSQAYVIYCEHNSNTENPHFESWATTFPANDSQSYSNAWDACFNNGGIIHEGFEPGDLR